MLFSSYDFRGDVKRAIARVVFLKIGVPVIAGTDDIEIFLFFSARAACALHSSMLRRFLLIYDSRREPGAHI